MLLVVKEEIHKITRRAKSSDDEENGSGGSGGEGGSGTLRKLKQKLALGGHKEKHQPEENLRKKDDFF